MGLRLRRRSRGAGNTYSRLADPIAREAVAEVGLNPATLIQALLIRYDPDAGIGWHRGRPIFEDVVGLSSSAPAVLRLRQRTGKGGFVRQSVP
jgi:DNA oxidative demethylase